MNRYEEMTGSRACSMHDPLAVGVALDRSFVRTKRLYVDVEADSSLCDGQTVCDFNQMTGHEPNMDVCLGVEGERFIRYLIQSMTR